VACLAKVWGVEIVSRLYCICADSGRFGRLFDVGIVYVVVVSFPSPYDAVMRAWSYSVGRNSRSGEVHILLDSPT